MRRGRETSRRLRREMVAELLDAILGLAFICGGLMALWFLGCAMA